MKSRDSRIRAAWLGIVWPLRCRPNPRAPWDGAARNDLPYTAWEPHQSHVRNAVQAAVDTRNPHVVRDVRKRVEVYYATLLADALAPIPGSAESVLALSQEVTRESAEASIALQRVLSEYPSPSLSTIEAAVNETVESTKAGTRCFDFLTALLHKSVRPHLTVAR